MIELDGQFSCFHYRHCIPTQCSSLFFPSFFHPLFCFPELVLTRCVYYVFTLDIVPQETYKAMDVSVTFAPASLASTNCSL